MKNIDKLIINSPYVEPQQYWEYIRDTREFDDDGKLIKGLEDTMSVNVGMDFAILTKVIQELNQTITSLQEQINELKNK